jgi:hypothetical protein
LSLIPGRAFAFAWDSRRVRRHTKKYSDTCFAFAVPEGNHLRPPVGSHFIEEDTVDVQRHLNAHVSVKHLNLEFLPRTGLASTGRAFPAVT